MNIPYRIPPPIRTRRLVKVFATTNRKLKSHVRTRRPNYFYNNNNKLAFCLFNINTKLSRNTYTCNRFASINNNTHTSQRWFSTEITTSNDEKEELSKENKQEQGHEQEVVPIRQSAPDDGVHHNVTVLEWYKGEGDSVEANEALCEIDTPEFSYDFQSSVGGVIAKIVAPAGTEVEPGDTLVYLAENEDTREAVVSFLEEKKNKNQKNDSKTSKDEDVNDQYQDDELQKWLRSVKEEFVEYADVFRKEGFDSLEAIETLTEDDLQQMEIKKGHSRILLKSIESMKK